MYNLIVISNFPQKMNCCQAIQDEFLWGKPRQAHINRTRNYQTCYIFLLYLILITTSRKVQYLLSLYPVQLIDSRMVVFLRGPMIVRQPKHIWPIVNCVVQIWANHNTTRIFLQIYSLCWSILLSFPKSVGTVNISVK